MVYTQRITLVSEGLFYTQNITEQVRAAVKESAIEQGMALIFYRHTTGAITIGEHEAGMLVDLESLLESIAPLDHAYKHHLRGYDTNGFAHLRTALLNVSVTVPVTAGDLDLGSYQEIILIDLDLGLKQRSLTVKVLGE